ncbi:MAG: LuxR C-terminal-related transcriptional regulator [Eggerthellaceae bacterium]|nr:LuxR C-terminal-related transcriptional regulator [Eggerthellaceae bacterium]
MLVLVTMLSPTALPSLDEIKRNAGELTSSDVSPIFWRTFAALALVLATSSVMNIAVFPAFDAVFTYARDISVLAGSLSVAVIGVVAMFRPATFGARAMVVASVSLLLVGAALLLAGFILASPTLLCVGASLAAIGRGITAIAVGLSLSRMNLTQASLCIALAFVAEYVLNVVTWLMPSSACVACFLAFPLIAIACVWRWAAQVLDLASEGVAPAESAVTQPRTLLPLGSQLFVCLFLFHLAFGFSLRFGGLESSTLADFAGIVPVAAVALYVLTMHRQFSTDIVARLSVLLVVAGFLLASVGTPVTDASCAVMLVAGSTSFDMVAWLVLVAVAMRNRHASVTMFAWGHGVGGVGSVVGASFGVWATDAWSGDGAALSVAAGIAILVIVGYALIGLRTFSFAQAVRSVVAPSAAGDGAVLEVPEGGKGSSKEAEAPSAEELFERCCIAIGDRYGLSPREREVFAMLARGRDRAYIEKQLTVSRNTVKSHVKHIYAKLDIHSHQDLIDLVEAEQDSI